MNEVIEEWIFKAEGDFTTAERELAATVAPNYDAVCYHSQQCAEKYLKALLIVRASRRLRFTTSPNCIDS